MALLDYWVLAAYMLGIVLIGVFYAKRNRSAQDMFAAGGQAPWWVSGLSGFMTMFSAGTFVVWGGIAYKYGLVAVSINLCYGIAALAAGYFVAGRWKTMGVDTPAEYIELRFGKSVVQLYTWAMLVYRIVGTGVALYALSIILVALMPLPEGNPFRDPNTGNLAVEWAILAFGLVVIIYTMAGGLWAVLMTDVLQFIVLNLSVLFVLVFMLQAIGGVGTFIEQAPAQFFAPVSEGYSLYFLMGWVCIHFFMVGADWAFAQRFISVPSAKEARKSAYLFGILYLVSPLVWLMPPMLYRVIDPSADPEQAYIAACLSVLPAGLVGLLIAAMFSATASLASSQLNVFAGVFTENFYRPLMEQRGGAGNLVTVGRWITLLIGLLLIAVAISIPYMGGAEKVIVSVTSLMVGPLFAPTVWGIFSRRLSARAVWSCVLLTFAAGGAFKWILSVPADGSISPSALAWLTKHSAVIELGIGILVPLSVLALFTFVIDRNGTPGWIPDTYKNATSNAGAVASDLPARVVAVAMGLCALLLMLIALISHERQLEISLFALVTSGISAAIYLLGTRKKIAPEFQQAL
ncbi:Na+:solute symporter [Microbulbifer sp. HZ11]|uniref:sodium:solute symporter family transporter n=1 Tax=Microbulbifer sp. HZ11 TaxID=1453501 RepID=UPI0005B81195|nr:Na+:solute symporter [Microbulbifer sp. HZ11]